MFFLSTLLFECLEDQNSSADTVEANRTTIRLHTPFARTARSACPVPGALLKEKIFLWD